MAKKKGKDTITVSETAPIEKTETELKMEARQRAVDAYRGVEKNYLVLAETLFTIKHKQWYRDYPYSTFVDYVEQDVGMSHVKAWTLTKIWDAIQSLNLPKDRLMEIGWSKAAILAQHATADNYEELLDFAEKASVQQFADRFPKTGSGPGGGSAGLVLKFVPGTASYDLLSQAVTAAKPLLDATETTETIVAYVCSEWISYSGTIPEAIPVERMIPFLERTYGGKFIYQRGDQLEEATGAATEVAVEEEAEVEPDFGEVTSEDVATTGETAAAEEDDLDLAELDKVLT